MNYSEVEFVSLFDGIAGFPLAWCRVTGQDPSNFHYLSSEIEKFPIAVAGKNFPKREELGDVTRVRYNPDNQSFELFQPSTQRPVPPTGDGTAPTDDHSHTTGDGDEGSHTNRHAECDADDGAVRDEPTGTGSGGCGRSGPDPVNDGEFRAGGSRRRIICFGSPCQGLSTAGKQKGLEDERSGLFHEAVRICGDARPDYAVWENVAGAFSSNDGEDFACVLRCFAAIGYDAAWTTIDAQWFGVPQRRRRVFLIAVRDGIPEGADLFDIGGRSREQTRQAIQLITQGRRGNHQQSGSPGAGTPTAAQGGTRTFDRKHFGIENVASTVSARDFKEATDLVAQPSVIKGAAIGRKPEAGPQRGEVLFDGTCYTLNATETHATAYNIQTNDGGDHKRPDRPDGGMYVNETDTSLTVGSTDETKIVEQTYWDGGQVSSTLTTTHLQQRSPEKNKLPCVIGHDEPTSPSIRRITPLETLRLQGFPDDWFDDVPGYSDTAAYRATGNSVAVPCVEWVFERIIEFDKQQRGEK